MEPSSSFVNSETRSTRGTLASPRRRILVTLIASVVVVTALVAFLVPMPLHTSENLVIQPISPYAQITPILSLQQDGSFSFGWIASNGANVTLIVAASNNPGPALGNSVFEGQGADGTGTISITGGFHYSFVVIGETGTGWTVTISGDYQHTGTLLSL